MSHLCCCLSWVFGLNLYKEPPTWNFTLFVFTNRKQWALHEYGVKYVIGRFHEYDALRPPEGVSRRVATKRLRAKQLQWRKGMQSTLMEKCPFDWTKITGPDPSEDDLAKAQAVSVL